MTDKQQNDENLGSFYMGRMRASPQPKRVLPKGVLTGGTVLAFAVIIWYAYPRGQEKYTDIDVPVITADTAPYKSKPTDPGGMDVPHRDSTVFESLDKKAASGKPEKLAPKQEEPLDRKKLGLDAKKPKLNLEPQMKQEAAKKEAEKPAAPAAASSAAYIQLGAYRSEGEAKGEWARVQKKYAALKGLAMRAQKADLGPKGTFYRLQAGAKSEAQARDLCETLRKGKTACIVVK